MDNAAQLLYDRLKEWQASPVGVPLINSRAIDGMSWIDTHLETLRWFVQVRDRMTDDVYTDIVNNMAIAILGGDIGVTGRPDGRAIISDSDLLVLKMLADNWGDVGYSPSSLGDIGNVTDEIIEFITAADDMDEDFARYVLELAQGLDKAVAQFVVFGPDGVRRLAAELIGALAVMFPQVPEDRNEKIRGFVNRLREGLANLLRVGAVTAVEAGVTDFLKALPARS